MVTKLVSVNLNDINKFLIAIAVYLVPVLLLSVLKYYSKTKHKRISEKRSENSANRIIGFDILRFLLAVLIFMRHARTMYGVRWYVPDRITISSTNFIMTCFFALSGFSMAMSTRNREFKTKDDFVSFYKKRLISIFPSYCFLHILYMIFVPDQVKNGVILAPVSFLGIQSMYRSLFGVFNFGGTWFIGCLVVCYIIYPLIHTLLPKSSKYKLMMFSVGITMLLFYSDYINGQYNMSGSYDNVFYRAGEFIIGILFYHLIDIASKGKYGKSISFLCYVISAAYLIAIIFTEHIMSFISYHEIHKVIFIFALFYSLYSLRNPILEKSKIIRYLGSISYEIYLMQQVAWSISNIILNYSQNNIAKKITCIAVTAILAIITRRISSAISVSFSQKLKFRTKKALASE